MAGRGVDIVLGGKPEDGSKFDLEKQDIVRQLGGLHIIGTERHESRRIDNQLRGRSGRQGDPGSSRFYLSLEDPLLRIFGGERLGVIMQKLKMPEGEPDFEEVAHPSPDQPLIYRLSGDTFALHVDAEFARSSGFEGPIMHGLCTLGFACRAVVKHLFPGEPERLVRLRNRFSRPLYPGRPIKTQIWKAEDGGEGVSRAFWRTIDVEKDKAVMDRGIVEWVSREEAQRRAF